MNAAALARWTWIASAVATAALHAEADPKMISAGDFGLAQTSSTLAAAAFAPEDSALDYETLSSDLSRTDGPASAVAMAFRAPLLLPTGAEVVSFTVQACNDTAQAMTAALVVCPFSGTCDDSRERIISPNSGCDEFGYTLPAPLTIQNGSNSYSLRIVDTNGQGSSFRGLRVFWHFQITPLDGSANYTDVPVGHPLRRYVEALGASHIALACATNKFCPDDPVTRGQFAVFLARALGLHFPD
jgi:hypothetical protein